jgi:hypothetical protein
MEDGYFVMLAAQSTSRLIQALRGHSSIHLIDGERTLTVALAAAGE